MENLPGLSKQEKAFACAFYPVFDNIKSIVLMVAGIVLLLGDDQKRTIDFEDNLAAMDQDLNGVIDSWAKFRPAADLRQDYATVERVLEEIATAINEIKQDFKMLSNESTAILANTLFTAYQDLRTVSLNYWRLELVPESGQLRHFH